MQLVPDPAEPAQPDPSVARAFVATTLEVVEAEPCLLSSSIASGSSASSSSSVPVKEPFREPSREEAEDDDEEVEAALELERF